MRSQSAMAGSLAHERASSVTSAGQRPTKTTRVRINSISEQIQDPNWLIRMSLELEESAQRAASNKSKNHLRALHRKLKSTITGGASSSSSQQAAVPPPHNDLSASTTDQSADQPAMPATPVKVPVSILKQRGAGQRAARPAPPPPSATVPQPTPHPPSQRPHPTASRPTRVRTAATPTSSAAATAMAAPAVPQPVQPKPAAPQPASVLATQPQPPSASQTQPAPICADGQVRVSGWKRNNLLAKTLSHFDEIRGNQRPIFVPTKIVLPPEAVGGGQRTQRAPPVSTSGGTAATNSKFAEIVREALSKKSQLSQDSSVNHHPTQIPPNQQLGSAANTTTAATKRASESQVDSQLEPRCASAIDRSPLTSTSDSQQQQHQQQRSNSVSQQLLSSSPQNTRQQVTVSLNRPSQQTTPEQLMSQLLSASESSAASGGASSRLFKLQHKNQQLLQNLRHELEASRASADLSASGGAPVLTGSLTRSSGGGSVRIKDWKRLTGKLSLLTGSGRSGASHSNSQQPPEAAGSVPLRLTHSNQESGGATRGVAGSGLQVPGQTRKLSSSSLVVQSSAKSHPANATSAGTAPTNSHSGQSSPLLMATPTNAPRRSSDSEAYQKPARSAAVAAAAAAAAAVVAGDLTSGAVQAPQPVVVNRKDLLQLLAVTGSSASRRSSVELRRAGSARSRWNRRSSKRCSLQLDDPKGGAEITPSIGVAASDKIAETVVFPTTPAARRPVRSSSAGDSLDLLLSPEPARPTATTVSVAASPPSTAGQPLRPRPLDLPRLVAKTSRVAFFQAKLRKMRWHSKQHKQMSDPQQPDPQKQQQQPGEPATTSIKQPDSNSSADDVFMDPTLIGDAIEIFLRSTMQSGNDQTAAASGQQPQDTKSVAAEQRLIGQ